MSIPKDYVSIKWSTGDTLTTINVSQSGTYNAYLINSENCRDTLSIKVIFADSAKPVIEKQGLLCKGNNVRLKTEKKYKSYQWSTSQFTDSIYINEPGLYSVKVWDNNGCPGTAKIKIDRLRHEINYRFTGNFLFEPEETYGNENKELEKKRKEEQEIKENTLKKAEQEFEDRINNKIYENSFEWRFEFPEVLDDNGDFIGFDVVIGNPPYKMIQVSAA